MIVDRWGNILRVSPSAEAILGYRPAELIGESAVKLLYPGGPGEHAQRDAPGAPWPHPGAISTAATSTRTASIVTLAWIGVWSEPEQQHFFIGRDMTERIKLEQQLSQAQRMEAIGQLTGGVAHDFNNILTVIIGMNEMLASAVARQPQLAELCKTIDEAAERGVQLTQRMLAFARKQPLRGARPRSQRDRAAHGRDAAADAGRAHPHRDRARAGPLADQGRSVAAGGRHPQPRGQCARRHAEGRPAAARDRQRSPRRAVRARQCRGDARRLRRGVSSPIPGPA